VIQNKKVVLLKLDEPQDNVTFLLWCGLLD